MRKIYAARLRNVLNASIASGRLAEDLNELTRAELEFIAHDWEIWARDDQLCPSLVAPCDSAPQSRPQGAAMLDDHRAASSAPGGRLDKEESPGAISKAWRVWLLLGGRGSGKTRAGAEWIRSIARDEDTSPRLAVGSAKRSRQAPAKNEATSPRLPAGSRNASRKAPPRIALVGKTLADVRNVMVEGQSGLLAIHPAHERPEFEPSKRRLTWPNGAIAELFSADEAEALRGPQFTAAWCDAFVGAMLKRANVPGTGSLLARSYLDWGGALDDNRLGAIAVFSRGDDPSTGHVAFVLGEAADKLYVLGGNQGNAVSVAAFDKAHLLGLLWPNAQADTPSAPATDDSIFAKVLVHVLEMEGGFSDDPYDPGGPTNKGITLEVYASFKGLTIDATSRDRFVSELKSIPDATVAEIYRRRYFEPADCSAFTSPLTLMHFDAAVNHGVGAALRMLQQAAGVTVDGDIGPETLAAIGTRNVVDLIESYAEIRRARYRALPHFWRFGRGWLRRVDATLSLGKSWASANGITRGLLEPAQNAKGETTMTATTTDDTAKWWAQSKTLWGTLITAAATVLPLLAPAIGVSLPADVIQTFGDQAVSAIQAVTGLFGTALAIYGRFTASSVLSLRKS
jgi:uncharacterized protein (TIGR02594 family)